MARTLNRLSAIKVKRMRKEGLHADGGGLYLRISGNSRTWIFRYRADGALHDMGLGPTHTIKLADAREEAAEQRKLKLRGIDPIEHRRATRAVQKAASATAMTFEECAKAYVGSHEAEWGNAAHRQQWSRTLAQYVYPTLGSLPVSIIDTALVMKVLDPIWKTKTETASRIRGRIEVVLDWAKVRGYRAGENPARWRGHLDHLLPAQSKIARVRHLAALPFAEVGEFMAGVRQQSGIIARALEFLILTAARAGEVRGARWSEIDFADRVWIVPADRMKGGREHRVPLSNAAVAVLKEMDRHGEYVFPGRRTGSQLSDTVILELAKQIAGSDITTHGFRSTFRDWAAERTNFPRDVAEMALAHAIPNAVEAAYRRGNLFDKRRRLMDSWAEYCGKPQAAGKVVAIRR